MRADGSLKSLLQGVSQQSARTRLPGQCTAQENFTSNPVNGLSRRAPTEYIKKLFSSSADVKFYEVDYGAGHEYIIAAAENSLRAFDLLGNEHAITDLTGGYPYITGAPLAFQTLKGNTSYIANTSKVCAMTPGSKAYKNYGSFIVMLGGSYSRDYKVTVTWNITTPAGASVSVTGTWSTPDGSNAAHTAEIATDWIAERLRQALVAITANGFNTAFTVTRVSDHLYIQWAGARTDKFTVTVSDGDSNTNIVACNNQVLDTSKLPLYAVQGYFVTVKGDPNSAADDYYLQFVIPPDSSGSSPAIGAGFGSSGTWKECVKDGIAYQFNQSTMPHKLVYDSVLTTFTFSFGGWGDRAVGDDNTNPLPSCIGNTIEDISFFQGRLALLTGDHVVLSRTNKPVEPWVKSATVSTDTDVIDVSSTAKGVKKMLRAIPHNRDLVVFSDAGQFIIFGRNAITPKNCSLVLTTKFEAEITKARPISAGRNVFFAINYGKYTSIREFYSELQQDANDSRLITQHVLKYIPGKAVELAASSNFDVLLVRAEAEANSVFTYEYIWEGDQKIQSSWSKWIFPNPIVMMFFEESTVYMVQKIDGIEYSLVKMRLDSQVDTDLTYNVRLDNKVYKTGITNTVDTLYDTYPDVNTLMFIQGEGCPTPGLKAEVASYDSGTGTFTLKKDMGGGTVIVGQKYKSSYIPTMPIAKDQDGIKIDSAKLTVSKFFVSLRESAGFVARVFSKYREDSLVSFSGFQINNPDTVIGEAPISDIVHTVPFRDSTDNAELELYTDLHLPMTILNIDWVGQYNKRGKRISGG